MYQDVFAVCVFCVVFARRAVTAAEAATTLTESERRRRVDDDGGGRKPSAAAGRVHQAQHRQHRHTHQRRALQLQ